MEEIFVFQLTQIYMLHLTRIYKVVIKYRVELVQKLQGVFTVVKSDDKRAQVKQKMAYNTQTKPVSHWVGNRVWL